MPTNHFAVAAVPATGATALLRSGAVGRYAYCLAASDDAGDFVAIDPDTGDVCPALVQNGLLYGLDNLDTTTAPGPTCLVSYDSKRYKLSTVAAPFSVLSKASTSPPVSPSIGDWYLLYATPSGDWAGKLGYLTVYTSRGWEFWLPPIGFRVLVEDEGTGGTFYFRDPNGDWQTGLGGIVLGSKTIPLAALMWSGASPVLRVQNQTTYVPPGSRATGATPTAPLGGTAANLNDNNAATLTTTSSLSDLTAAALASRIVAQLDLGATKTLIGIEAKALSISSGTASPVLYYSTDGTTWTALGAALSVTTTGTTFIRTGSVSARYVALVLDQANYSGKTLSVGDLNAYTDAVTASVGDAYIIGTGGIGIFAGNDGKVALCETANAFTIDTPQTGDRVYDISLGIDVLWNGTAWASAGGTWVKFDRTETLGTGSLGSHATAGRSIYNFSTSAPDTSLHANTPDNATVSHTANRTGALLRFRYSCFLQTIAATASGLDLVSSNIRLTAALIRGAETVALKWRQITAVDIANLVPTDFDLEFIIAASDALAHTYKVVFFDGCVNNSTNDSYVYPTAIALRELYVEEGG